MSGGCVVISRPTSGPGSKVRVVGVLVLHGSHHGMEARCVREGVADYCSHYVIPCPSVLLSCVIGPAEAGRRRKRW